MWATGGSNNYKIVPVTADFDIKTGDDASDATTNTTTSTAIIAAVTNYPHPGINQAVAEQSHHGKQSWSNVLKKKVVDALTIAANEAAGSDFLSKHHWPPGLINVLLKNIKKIPVRFFIVDNSGSMATADGQHLVVSGSSAR